MSNFNKDALEVQLAYSPTCPKNRLCSRSRGLFLKRIRVEYCNVLALKGINFAVSAQWLLDYSNFCDSIYKQFCKGNFFVLNYSLGPTEALWQRRLSPHWFFLSRLDFLKRKKKKTFCSGILRISSVFAAPLSSYFHRACL